MGAIVMKVLLLLAASIVLASSKLTIYHGRVSFGGNNAGVQVQQVEGVATLALGGTSSINQFFDCNSTTGSNLISNLIWEKEGGSIRFEVQPRSNAKRLDLAAPDEGTPVLGYQDEGIYTCRDIDTKESVSLNATGGTLAVCPADPMPEAIMGTEVSLTVYVAGYPAVMGKEIEWHGPGNVILLNSSRHMLVEGNKTLLIQNVGVGDSGTYRIDLRRRVFGNSFLNVTTTIELNVLVVPTVESNPSSVMVLEHDDVTFTCNISGYPAPLVVWERDSGNMLPVVTRTKKTTVQSPPDNNAKFFTIHSTYSIRGVFLEDVGGYRCSATNSASPTAVKTNFATLSVTARLQLRAEVGGLITTIPDARLLSILTTPTSVEIECVGSGALTWTSSTGAAIPLIKSASNPADNVYQRSDITSNKQTLFIQSFTASDRAVYTCSTSLQSVEISDAVLITSSAIDIYITEPILYATTGNTISISAVYTSPTTPTIAWSLNGTVIDTASNPRYTASMDGSMMAVLSIASVAEDVLGYYMVAIEVGGVTQKDTVRLLYPSPPTSSVQPTSLSAGEGDSVRFQCHVGGTDSTAQWTMEGNRHLSLDLSQSGTEIVIQSVSRTDAGRYVCTVSNRLGVSVSTATLVVLYPPIAKVTHQETTSINQLIEVTAREGDLAPIFSCSSDGYPLPDLLWVGHASGGRFPDGVTQKRQSTDQILVWSRKLVYTDSGFYNCMAQNSRGSNMVTLSLLVKRSPTITSIYSTSTSRISPSSTSSFLVPLNYTGNILTCSGYGWPPPSIEWVREGQSVTGKIFATGQNSAFVSARLTLGEGEFFGESRVGDYSCIIWSGDGTNQTYRKVVTLTSSTSVGATPTSLPTCTSESLQQNFQIRVLDTECESWGDGLKETIARNFHDEMLNIISTECQNCAATGESVTILDTPTCSSELPGAAVFRGSITTGEADTTEDIFCTLDAWYRAGPLLQVNNKFHLVDQNCTLMFDTSTNAECSLPPAATRDTPLFIIALAAVAGVVLVAVMVLCVVVCTCCYYSHRKQETIDVGKVRMNSQYERTHHDQPRYTTQVTPEDHPPSLTDTPDAVYSTLDQSKIVNPFHQPSSQSNSDRTSPDSDPALSRNNSAARLLNTSSSKTGRMFHVAQDGARPDEEVACSEHVDSDYPLSTTASSSVFGRSLSHHSSFTDHASMVMAERRAILGTNPVPKVDPNSDTADYEVVDQKYRARHTSHFSNSSSKLSIKSGHSSASAIGGQPPVQVKRHRSLMEGQVWEGHAPEEDADYAQLDRCIPESARTPTGAGEHGRVGGNGKSNGLKSGRGGRGHSASSLQMSSMNSSPSNSAPANEGRDRPAKRQMSLPGPTEQAIPANARPRSDDPRICANVEGKTQLSPAHEATPPPPSYREVIFSDSSMMDNNAYEPSNVVRQAAVEHRPVKPSASLSNVASLESGEIQQFWYNNNPREPSVGHSTAPKHKSMTRLDLAPYSQISNSEIDARNSEEELERDRRASSESIIKPTPYTQPIVDTQRPEAEQKEHRVPSQTSTKPSPYTQPITNVKDLTTIDSNLFSSNNMVLV